MDLGTFILWTTRLRLAYREMLKSSGWKEKFFLEGTKQARWRKLYNNFRQKIIEKIGGLDAFKDKRFLNWIKDAHENMDQVFREIADTMPT